MTVRLSLLALLREAPCYGYQLRTELDVRTGGAGPVNVGQIYNTLDRLERDKLVRKTEETNYYEITDAGAAEVAAWFGSASPSADLAAKLALASTLASVDAREVVAVQRRSIDAGSTTARRPADAIGLARSIVESADEANRTAELALLDRVDEMLTHGIAPLPISSEVPKRGRPPRIR